MDPAGKKPSDRQQAAPPPVRKLRFDAAHPRVPRPPHSLPGRNGPPRRSDDAA